MKIPAPGRLRELKLMDVGTVQLVEGGTAPEGLEARQSNACSVMGLARFEH